MTYNEAKKTFHIGREFSNLHREPAYKKLDGSIRGKIRIVQDIKKLFTEQKLGKQGKFCFSLTSLAKRQHILTLIL